MKSIYHKTGTFRSDYVAPHNCEILEQMSHRRATAGKELIEGMNEVLVLQRARGQTQPPRTVFFFKLCDCLKRKMNFQSDGTESGMFKGNIWSFFFLHMAEQ